jgi:exopolysaccharide biosynthesis polyprenyl glycosylphosphotransferase
VLIRLPWLITRRRLLTAVLIDVGIFAGLYSVCFQQRYGSSPAWSPEMALLLVFWLLTSYVQGRYYDYDDPRTDAAIKQAVSSLLALVFSLSVYLAYNWITANALNQSDSRSLLVPFLFLQTCISALVQFLLNRLLQDYFEPLNLWLVLGTAESLEGLHQAASLSRLPCKLHAVQPAELLKIALATNPAGVVFDPQQSLEPALLERLLELQAEGIEVLSTLGWCERVLQRFPSRLLGPEDMLRGEFARPGGSLQRRLKRLGDVVVSASLLLITTPLLLLAALLIRVQDGGPAFYSQLRSGLGGTPYRVWKLRSMRMGAELSGPQWSGRGDPRITRLGLWLRLTRLDELPQLIAVFTGAMSLIGPRPERPEFDLELERQIPYYRLRYGIRPGLSGWAQVNYPYGASVDDAANKLSYDLFYLRNFSFWLDLLILVKTIRLVFNARGSTPL